MFVRAFSDGELFDSLEWLCALQEYRDKLENHEYEDEEVYRVFPYYVKEVEAPVKRTGKLSVREAVMNSNMNSEEARNQYARQMPSTQAAANEQAKKRAEASHPSFKGSTQPPPERAIKPPTNQPSAYTRAISPRGWIFHPPYCQATGSFPQARRGICSSP